MRDHFRPAAANLLPIHVLHAELMPTGVSGVVRLKESLDHNTRKFPCRTFYKPISRCEESARQPPHWPKGPCAAQSEASPVPSAGVFRLFANCVPVKGARRSTLCDLQNGCYCFIPNALFYMLTECSGLTIDRIKAHFDTHDNSAGIVDEYFRFLVDNEFGFFCDEPERFPPIDFTFLRPEQITNAVLDIRNCSDHPYEDIIDQLVALGCRALQVRFFDEMPLAQIEKILHTTERHTLRHLDILIQYTPEMTDDALLLIVAEHPAISQISVHAAPARRELESPQKIVRVCFWPSRCDSSDHCGFVQPAYFALNLEHFSEAQHHNTCLNLKIAIDANGEIKNCPALSKSFGNVRSTRLADVVALRPFRNLWEIKKDAIEVCRECEFRYMCTDCRALLTDPSNILSKPAKCGYDPLTGTWSEVTPGNGERMKCT